MPAVAGRTVIHPYVLNITECMAKYSAGRASRFLATELLITQRDVRLID
jgi:hypothetical protein